MGMNNRYLSVIYTNPSLISLHVETLILFAIEVVQSEYVHAERQGQTAE